MVPIRLTSFTFISSLQLRISGFLKEGGPGDLLEEEDEEEGGEDRKS
jgi:hypothetical protein